MRTLASELEQHLGGSPSPRVYADANVPAGLVGFMRLRLKWDVFFVMEHDDLRRASDRDHYQLSRRMARTLLTLDRDYFDERRFPSGDGAGVIVLSAPDERAMARILRRIDRAIMRRAARLPSAIPGLPLAGQKLHAHSGWR